MLEKQPPQVIKTANRFSSTVRYANSRRKHNFVLVYPATGDIHVHDMFHMYVDVHVCWSRILVGGKLQIHLGFPEVQVSIIK